MESPMSPKFRTVQPRVNIELFVFAPGDQSMCVRMYGLGQATMTWVM